MSTGWENNEAAPLEFFHGKLMELFHHYREQNNQPTEATINGVSLNNLIAAAKNQTYHKYPKQVNSNSILKTEL